MEEPKFPKGTPEYDACAAVLRTELAKFAAGESPYEYDRDPLVTGKPWPGQDRCVVKIGEPYHMAECGKPVEYLTFEQSIAEGLSPYSGWRHVDRDLSAHNGVPSRVVW